MDCIPYIILVLSLTGDYYGTAEIDPCIPETSGFLVKEGGAVAYMGEINYLGKILAVDEDQRLHYLEPWNGIIKETK